MIIVSSFRTRLKNNQPLLLKQMGKIQISNEEAPGA